MFKHKFFILPLLAALILTGGLGCKSSQNAQIEEATKPITLKYWRVFDGQDAFDEIIQEYAAMHPHIKIEYKKLRFEDYEKELVDALAEDRGPDIFSIQNTWMNSYLSKMEPVPAKITMAFTTVSGGGMTKSKVTTLQTKPSITIKQLNDNFVDVVAEDAIIQITDDKGKTSDKIYGLPLAMDTLVLYYNRDILNAAKIPQVPTTWKDFQSATSKLTRLDKDGNILQSGAALGTSKNVERYFDILSLLMMQNGTKMVNGKTATFHQMPEELSGRQTPPGEEALIFYTDFAAPSKEVYSWNKDMPNNLAAFTQGKAAFFFGYAYHLPIIRANSPKLNLGIAKVPQIEGAPEINYANYWMEVVSKKSKNISEAWDFVQFAVDSKQVTKYLDKVKKPSALRSIIEEQLEDVDIGTAASQALTAESWYRGNDIDETESAFSQMIDSVVSRQLEADKAIELAARRVQQTLR